MNKPYRLTETQTQEAVEDYEKRRMSTRQIAKKHGLSPAGMRELLQRNGVVFRSQGDGIRKYSLDQGFFDKIDTEEKAYILGFLYGDGAVTPLNVSIAITGLQSDRQIFEDIGNAMNSNRPMTITKRGHLVFAVSSKRMRDRLYELGVVPNKTKIITFPHDHVPECLRHHFIRGLFDSDGCITCAKDMRGNTKRYMAQWQIYSTRSMLSSVKDIMASEGIDTNELTKDKRCYENSAILATSKAETLHRIREYLYKDSTICLERKRARFDEILLLKPREGLRHKSQSSFPLS